MVIWGYFYSSTFVAFNFLQKTLPFVSEKLHLSLRVAAFVRAGVNMGERDVWIIAAEVLDVLVSEEEETRRRRQSSPYPYTIMEIVVDSEKVHWIAGDTARHITRQVG